MAASKPTASVAAPAEQHPVPYARRKRFVEQEASIYEIMTWGAAPLSPARPVHASTGAEPSSAHRMKTRSQAAAAQEAAAAAAAAATALLLKKKLQRKAMASKVKGSSIVLASAAPIQSPWGTKTLQQPRAAGKAAGRKQEAAVVVEPAGAGAAAAVTNAHRSSKALFPYPHTPGKAKVVAAAEQAAVQGKTRQLSDTAFAKRYQRPVFGASSPGKAASSSPAAKQPLEQQQPQQPQQPRVRQVWPKAAAAASGPVVAMGRTPVKGATKTPSGAVSAAKGMGGGKAGTATGKKRSKSGRKQQQGEAEVLAWVEAGYRDFVAALEREREAATAGEGASFQQQTRRRATRSSSSSSGGGNVVVLASSTPAGKAGRRSSSKRSKKAPAAVGEAGDFVVVEHTDAPPAEVAKALAEAGAAVVVVGDEAASLVLDATVDSSSGVGAAARSEGAEAALTVLKSKAARRKKGKKGYDEENETSDSEGEALKTDPRAYRQWVERIPVAGTKIVKGLSVADCFEG